MAQLSEWQKKMYGMLKSQKPPPPSLVVFKDKYPPRDEERLKAISFKNPNPPTPMRNSKLAKQNWAKLVKGNKEKFAKKILEILQNIVPQKRFFKEYLRLQTEEFKHPTVLSQTQIKSVRWYTGDNYKDLNRRLRQGIQLTQVQEMNAINIDSVFKLATPISQDIVLFRGMSVDLLGPNESSIQPSFISCSYDEEAAINFTGDNCCLYIVLVKKGARIICLEAASIYGTEHEVLLPRLGTFTYTSEDTETVMKGFTPVIMKRIFMTYTPHPYFS